MHPMLNVAVTAARTAGRTMLRFIDRLDEIQVSKKDRNDLVTEVDQVCEQEIKQIIQKAYPNHSILGEESGLEDHHNEYTWIIDPLDGTANYVHGYPHFAISIAVKKGDNIEVGCVYDPIRQELFTATKGQGAQLNSRRIRVSKVNKLEQAMIGTGFPFKDEQHFKAYLKTFEKIFPQSAGVRRAGSAALDLAYVAAGRLDAFWEFVLKPWDIAAGSLLILEAGGMLSDFEGEPNYLDTGSVVAGNIKTHQSLLGLVQKTLHQ